MILVIWSSLRITNYRWSSEQKCTRDLRELHFFESKQAEMWLFGDVERAGGLWEHWRLIRHYCRRPEDVRRAQTLYLSPEAARCKSLPLLILSSCQTSRPQSLASTRQAAENWHAPDSFPCTHPPTLSLSAICLSWSALSLRRVHTHPQCFQL